MHRQQELIRVRFAQRSVIAANVRIKQLHPTGIFNSRQFVLEKLPVTIGNHTDLNVQASQAFEHRSDFCLKGFYGAVVIAVMVIERLVGNLFCFLIITEEHFKNIRARDLPVGLYLGVKLGKLTHISHQSGVLRGFAVFRRHHSRH